MSLKLHIDHIWLVGHLGVNHVSKKFQDKKMWSTSQKNLQCNNVQDFTMRNIIFQAHLPPHNFETWKFKRWIERYTNALQIPKQNLEKINKSSTSYRICLFKKWIHLCSQSIPDPSFLLRTLSLTSFIHIPSRHPHGGQVRYVM